MFEAHPSSEDFNDFLINASRPANSMRNARVIRHLLGGCSECRDRLADAGWSESRLSRLFQPVPETSSQDEAASSTMAVNGHDYGRAFAVAERAVSAFLAPEQSSDEIPVDELMATLSELSARHQSERVKSDPRYATPPMVRAMIERSHSVRFRDAEQMLRYAQLAKLAVEDCSASLAGGEMKLADLRTRAWGQFGNALRVSSRIHEAEEALKTAQSYRRQGTGDPVLRAWLLERTSALAAFQNRFGEAIEMCEEAGQVYQELGQTHLFAFTLVQKATALIYSGETESALRTLLRAIPLIDHEEDPHLLLAACYNLVRCYIDLDQPDQALTLYAEIRELFQEFNDPLITLKLIWQEGRLLRDLGHLRAAEAALLQARKGYLERNISYEVAVVSLDLAAVYVKLGLTDEVKKTVLSAVPIFHALRVKLDTLAALLQLQRVADQEQQALELIRTLHSRIEALPRKPVG